MVATLGLPVRLSRCAMRSAGCAATQWELDEAEKIKQSTENLREWKERC
jgi:hypothetical protein